MMTKTPAGRKPKSVDANEIQFYNLSAEPISIDEVGKKLASLRPVFLIDQSSAEPLAMPEIAKRAMHENCVIAVTEKKIREMPQNRGWWAAQPLPVFQVPQPVFQPPAAQPPVLDAPVLPNQDPPPAG